VEDEWIYLKDETPPQGAWCVCRGWHEIVCRYQPNNKECEWLEDEFAQQYGRLVQWRFVKNGEVSDQAKKVPPSKR